MFYTLLKRGFLINQNARRVLFMLSVVVIGASGVQFKE